MKKLILLEKSYIIQNVLLIGKIGLYVREALFLHLYVNFESKSVNECRSYVHVSDVMTKNYFSDYFF